MRDVSRRICHVQLPRYSGAARRSLPHRRARRGADGSGRAGGLRGELQRRGHRRAHLRPEHDHDHRRRLDHLDEQQRVDAQRLRGGRQLPLRQRLRRHGRGRHPVRELGLHPGVQQGRHDPVRMPDPWSHLRHGGHDRGEGRRLAAAGQRAAQLRGLQRPRERRLDHDQCPPRRRQRGCGQRPLRHQRRHRHGGEELHRDLRDSRLGRRRHRGEDHQRQGARRRHRGRQPHRPAGSHLAPGRRRPGDTDRGGDHHHEHRQRRRRHSPRQRPRTWRRPPPAPPRSISPGRGTRTTRPASACRARPSPAARSRTSCRWRRRGARG